jgi:hypothetical protein
MMHRFLVGAAALLVVMGMAAASPAATIQEVLATQFDPTKYDFYASGYGHDGYYLTWNNVGSTDQFLAGQPAREFAHMPAAGNPSWLNFQTISTNAPAASTNGKGGLAPTLSLYKLGVNTNQAWSMDFSILFYDPSFDGIDMTAQLQGSVAGANNYAARVLSETDVRGGTMIQWHIDATAGETVDVSIIANGDESYAAGFFMDNYTLGGAAATSQQSQVADSVVMDGALPEPATLGLLLFGLGGAILGRRRSR